MEPESIVLEDPTDGSVNVIFPTDDGGAFEVRRVQREASTLIVYLSSMNGCDRACRFCHLTQQGHTTMLPASVYDYFTQAERILGDYLDDVDTAKIAIVHYNFMSRGDALSNANFRLHFEEILTGLHAITREYLGHDVESKFKISTIFPTDLAIPHTPHAIREQLLNPILALPFDIEFYYSLYSTDTQFRKRWIPKAIDPEIIGEAFRGMRKGLRLHHALIRGENDCITDASMILEWLKRWDLKVGLNLVRYNPANERCGQESPYHRIEAYRDLMKANDPIEFVQIVTRVSTEVYAACGMFYPGEEK